MLLGFTTVHSLDHYELFVTPKALWFVDFENLRLADDIARQLRQNTQQQFSRNLIELHLPANLMYTINFDPSTIIIVVIIVFNCCMTHIPASGRYSYLYFCGAHQKRNVF